MATQARTTFLRRTGAIVAAIATAASAMFVGAVSASAAPSPTFGVMNTSETLPDGVYFRDSPTGSAVAIDGYGVFAGEQIRAICYRVGSPVAPYDNRIWYNATNVSRPTVDDRANAGWLNTHFVDDGQVANKPHPDVPECNANGTPPGGTPTTPAGPTAIFFSPEFTDPASARPAVSDEGPSTVTRLFNTWAGGEPCNTAKAISSLPGSVTTLSGFSLGRLGPPYVLARANEAQRQQITHITMIDPGEFDELRQSCDNEFVTVVPGTKKRPGE